MRSPDCELGGFKKRDVSRRFKKNVFASVCDTPLGLTRTFCSAEQEAALESLIAIVDRNL